MATPMNAVDSSFDAFEGVQRQALLTTFRAFERALPGATSAISYGMPSIKIGTTPVVSVWGFNAHNSIFPGPDAIARVADKLVNHTVTKGTVHFDRDKPLSSALVKAFAKAGIDSLNARYPKKDGTFLEYYDNGYPKQQGKYRDGQMHGQWSWWRRDGSLMRTGSFREGEKTGEWVTYGRDSLPI
jgi:uncharacterized protein YdhG (YjbR/CyaY superfamily)